MTILFAALIAALILQLTSILLALIKQTRPPQGGITGAQRVTILRPVCGLENNLEQTLQSTFDIDYPGVEIVFCAARRDDPAAALVRRLIAAHPGRAARLLIGDDPISRNPKLNNLVKGWAAARGDWILMADSNVILPADTMTRLFGAWRADTGLVTSPAAGCLPLGFAARLECAFLNGFQGRWQQASDQLGRGFAQGKMLFWQRDFLDQAGGLAALSGQMAEDVAATKLVRARGKKVRLTARLFDQPLGRRSLRAVWARQLRWSKVRRLGFLPLFMAEILTGGAAPMLAALALVLGGAIAPLAAAGFALIWYGAEYLLARRAGWPAGAGDVLAWICRDALMPMLWCAAWFGNGFEWRGNAMTPPKQGRNLAQP